MLLPFKIIYSIKKYKINWKENMCHSTFFQHTHPQTLHVVSHSGRSFFFWTQRRSGWNHQVRLISYQLNKKVFASCNLAYFLYSLSTVLLPCWSWSVCSEYIMCFSGIHATICIYMLMFNRLWRSCITIGWSSSQSSGSW